MIIRKKYFAGGLLGTAAKAVYKANKDKIKSICEFCKNNIADEIHHLKYRKDMKNDINLNHKSNLSSICSNCHDSIHRLGLTYERKKTLEGYKIILKKN